MEVKIKSGIISFFIVLMLLAPSLSFSESWSISFEALQENGYTNEAIYFKVLVNDGKHSEDFIIMKENSEEIHWYYYVLDLGDGSEKTGFANTNPFYVSCIYNKAGEYYPKISVKNAENNEWKHKVLSKPIKIEKSNTAPVGKINFYGENKVGEVIKFDGSASYDEDGYIVSYKWNFGDGSTANGEIVEHAYDKPGYYTVSLIVKDNKGSEGFDVAKIEIVGKGLPTVSSDDPSQEDTSGGFVKIYGGAYYAQSFIPNPEKQKMNELYIYVGKKTFEYSDSNGETDSSENNNMVSSSDSNPGVLMNSLRNLGRISFKDIIVSFISKILGKSTDQKGYESKKGNSNPYQKLSDLYVYIKDDLNGKIIARVTISPEEVSKSNGWLRIDLSSANVLFDIRTLGKKPYYIVLYCPTGSSISYYKWYYSTSDVYANGSAYERQGSVWYDLGYDFAFKTTMAKSGKEPDGVVNRWAIVIGVVYYDEKCSAYYKPAYGCDNAANDIAAMLEASGWHVVKLLNEEATYKRVESEISKIRNVEDADDVCLFFFSGHGYALHDCVLFDSSLEVWYRDFASYQIIIDEGCFSGRLITNTSLPKEGRIILTSSKEDEVSWGRVFKSVNKWYGVFSYYLLEGLRGKADGIKTDEFTGTKDGWVSAEEAFYYAKPRVESEGRTQHPQIYDGIEGEVWLTKCQ
ncbi:MAG: PKD domain-containing protein [Thermoplasmatales archaeon]|nr:PKD domain-containing protein [Thermoplasmatales archaeon]